MEVQNAGPLEISIQSLVPFQVDTCYVKFTFPKELQVDENKLLGFYGGGMLFNNEGSEDNPPVSFDLTSKVKYVLFKGCND